MRKKILQALAMVLAAFPAVGLAQAPKDGVYIGDEDVKAVLKHAVDTKRTIPDNTIRVIDMDKYQLGVAEPLVQRQGANRLERIAFRIWAWVMRHPRIYELAGMAAASLAPATDNGAWVRQVTAAIKPAPLRAWLSQRDLPPSPPKSFRQMWRER